MIGLLVLLLAVHGLHTGAPLSAPLFAQGPGKDDDGGDDDAVDPGADDDVTDPDEADPGADPGADGDADVGDPDGSDPDGGDPDAGGPDDFDDGGSDDGVGGGGGDDGRGSDDGGSDDGGAGDDSGSGGIDDNGGSDDNGGHGSDDDGSDDDISGSGKSEDDDDDKVDNSGKGNAEDRGDDDDDSNDDKDDDRDDDSEDELGRWDLPGAESAATRAELDLRDRIDTDDEGFRYRRGEFVALDLSEDDLALLEGQGFEVVAREQLASVEGTLLLLRGPPQLTGEAARDALDALGDPDSIGLNHLFDSAATRTRKTRGKAAPPRTACGCEIGLIDTGVAANLANFSHVQLTQQAFNGKQTEARLHGTAVAYLVSGTKGNPARATRIYVADIFSGPRETAGSSFALIKALDWLAARRVPVINISLSGPRNPAVAKAIARIAGQGHIIVAAAGNDGPAAPPVFPGAYEGVVSVTAVDAQDRVYRYANRGGYVDFAAHGVAVAAIDDKGALRDATGTSFAAPIVAARLAARLRAPDAAASRRAVQALEGEARDLGPRGRDPIYGVGLIGEQP
ncbi:S8 family serine peptidase [Porphyrobacter sp. YT40]|uniref:S8 family serine peptidase n=1 Tax=Porphyrobacter sp. YT40 TaxID=2547601 RepID=UPI0015E8A676|nr:S8 family serine peptidase [Porphyrobacter sp. YT40]